VRIGVPRETKDGERRVGMTPAGAATLVADRHDVVVERDAGTAVGFTDADYAAAGARCGAAHEAWDADLVVKVKEIQAPEMASLRPGSTVLGFAQLNRDASLLDGVLRAGVCVVGCETVRDAHGGLPMLAPMSRIAGRLASLVGAQCLATDRGGAGVLLCGVDDVAGANVVVIGAGAVGGQAAGLAARLGCHVVVFSRGLPRLRALEQSLARAGTPIGAFMLSSSIARFEAALAGADLVIGGVLEPGTLSPKLITRRHLRTMRPGSALVDVGIDQGGIAETSRMTRLSEPTYVDEGIVHYAVPNMPALVARTATLALAAATLPYARALAARGTVGAATADPGLAAGVMTWDGAVVHAGLAADRGVPLAQAPWT
jgi:alanine dehydrogenase